MRSTFESPATVEQAKATLKLKVYKATMESKQLLNRSNSEIESTLKSNVQVSEKFRLGILAIAW